jgi:L-threonylcarbamoyladenylate synthase
MLSSKISAQTPVFIAFFPFITIPTAKSGFKNKINNTKIIAQEVLSEVGALNESAQKLYASLHRLDHLNLDIIIAEKFPDFGLGRSINDLLRRATVS